MKVDAESMVLLEPGSLALPGGTAERFEGGDFGVGLSYFLVRTPPGKGPAVHWHPYAETWLVLEGEATFRLDDGDRTVGAGATVIVPAGRWHGFTNHGQEPLLMVCLHDSPRIIQEFRDQDG
ncbi:cupin domain-containing protein [Arthrobacter woluwensis]|uniref:cupin domain-containing protein n=1 Tax=Arthrobacter woluwensis TaxID=156980 RepID=UPI001FD41736|nr:cupin domain-containing protein [Arthrobacter woluwensis]